MAIQKRRNELGLLLSAVATDEITLANKTRSLYLLPQFARLESPQFRRYPDAPSCIMLQAFVAD